MLVWLPSPSGGHAGMAFMAQLHVVTGRPGVYMMYPGPAANGVVMGGLSVGAPLGGESALGHGVAPLLGPALDPGLVPDLGPGPAGRVAELIQ